MDIINRVRLEIGGMRYTISSREPESYVLTLASEINQKLDELLANKQSLSLNDALVLCILDYADLYKKSEQNADHIRDQLTGYLEDANKARLEAGELRSEVTRLKRDNSLLRKELRELRESQKGQKTQKEQG